MKYIHEKYLSENTSLFYYYDRHVHLFWHSFFPGFSFYGKQKNM